MNVVWRRANDGLWHGPYHRLAESLSKSEGLIERGTVRRMRHCMGCGRNGRLRRIDDERAASCVCDVPDAAVSARNAAATAKQIICLECGQGRTRFRRHLWQAHQITSEQYRQKWGLPIDFPLVPQGYLRQKSPWSRVGAATVPADFYAEAIAGRQTGKTD